MGLFISALCDLLLQRFVGGDLVLQRIYSRSITSVSVLLRPLTPRRIDLLAENENPPSILHGPAVSLPRRLFPLTRLHNTVFLLFMSSSCVCLFIRRDYKRPTQDPSDFNSQTRARAHTRTNPHSQTHTRKELRKHPYPLSFHLFFSTGF